MTFIGLSNWDSQQFFRLWPGEDGVVWKTAADLDEDLGFGRVV
jgi:hypothetical protein